MDPTGASDWVIWYSKNFRVHHTVPAGGIKPTDGAPLVKEAPCSCLGILRLYLPPSGLCLGALPKTLATLYPSYTPPVSRYGLPLGCLLNPPSLSQESFGVLLHGVLARLRAHLLATRKAEHSFPFRQGFVQVHLRRVSASPRAHLRCLSTFQSRHNLLYPKCPARSAAQHRGLLVAATYPLSAFLGSFLKLTASVRTHPTRESPSPLQGVTFHPLCHLDPILRFFLFPPCKGQTDLRHTLREDELLASRELLVLLRAYTVPRQGRR